MIKPATNQILLQLKNVLEQLNNEQLSSQLDVLNGSTIGMHVRHILEFFMCLTESQTTFKVNYDLRDRDTSLEVSTDKCIKTLNKILFFLTKTRDDYELELSANYSLSDESEKITLKSTFLRELLYNVEHTIHHLAIIKIGIKALNINLVADETFGVAASTIRNKKVCAQ